MVSQTPESATKRKLRSSWVADVKVEETGFGSTGFANTLTENKANKHRRRVALKYSMSTEEAFPTVRRPGSYRKIAVLLIGGTVIPIFSVTRNPEKTYIRLSAMNVMTLSTVKASRDKYSGLTALWCPHEMLLDARAHRQVQTALDDL